MLTQLIVIDSLLSQSFKLSKVREVRLPTTPAYVQVMPIKAKKVLNIRKIVHYIPEKHRGLSPWMGPIDAFDGLWENFVLKD